MKKRNYLTHVEVVSRIMKRFFINKPQAVIHIAEAKKASLNPLKVKHQLYGEAYFKTKRKPHLVSTIHAAAPKKKRGKPVPRSKKFPNYIQQSLVHRISEIADSMQTGKLKPKQDRFDFEEATVKLMGLVIQLDESVFGSKV